MRLMNRYSDTVSTVRYDFTGTYGVFEDGQERGEYRCASCANHRAQELVERRRRECGPSVMKQMRQWTDTQRLLRDAVDAQFQRDVLAMVGG